MAMSAVPTCVRINFATLRELTVIPFIGKKSAAFLIGVREKVGNFDKESFLDFVPLKVTPEVLACIDFAPNKIYSDFEEDLDSDDSDMEDSIQEFKVFLEGLKSRRKSTPKPIVGLTPMGPATLSKHRDSIIQSFDKMGGPLRAPGERFAESKNPTPGYAGESTEWPFSRGSGKPKPELHPREIWRSSREDFMSSEPVVTEPTPSYLGASTSLPSFSRIGSHQPGRSVPATRHSPTLYNRSQEPVQPRLQRTTTIIADFKPEQDTEAGGTCASKKASDIIRKIPRGLMYDGTSNWVAFKRKFEKFAELSQWKMAECLYYLSW